MPVIVAFGMHGRIGLLVIAGILLPVVLGRSIFVIRGA